MIAGLLSTGVAQAQTISPRMPFDITGLPAPSVSAWNDFAWQSFVASNWPVAPGTRGVPDAMLKIGARDARGALLPVVWMTSKAPGDVFLAKAAPPNTNWQVQQPTPACTSVPGYDPATSYVLGMISKTSPGAYSAINQAQFPGSQQVVGPVIDQAAQYVRYDIRMDQSEFQYLLNTRYYNADVQTAAVKATPSTFVAPPFGNEPWVLRLPPYARYGAVEYKASWRPLDPKTDIVSRYFSINAFIVNPDGRCFGPTLMGLTGLHILRLTPATPKTWFWSTFEQVDNLTVPSIPRPDGKPLTPSFGNGKTFVTGYNYKPTKVVSGPLPPQPPVDVSRVTPIQTISKPVTTAYQRALAGTPWQYYELVGVQFPVNPVVNGQVVGTAKGNGACYAAGTNNATNNGAQINECYLANVTMETFVQSTSCVTCHSYGVPIGVDLTSRGRARFRSLVNFQIFSFMLREAKSP
jgi:hypothetical protein